MPYPNKTMVDLLSDVTARHPERIALKDTGSGLTYQQLYSQSRSAAAILIDHNIKAGDRVICLCQKNNLSIVCFWAIQMSGAIPVLLDEEEGIEKNLLKIKAVLPKAILINTKNNDISLLPDKLTCIDSESLLKEEHSPQKKHPDLPRQISDCCYILLTSGTTGSPKAVQIPHTAILHYTYSLFEFLSCPENVKAAHVSTLSADLGITNLVMALISGGTLRLFSKNEATDPLTFKALLVEEKITLLKTTASHFTSLNLNGPGTISYPIDILILGGEKLSWPVTKSIFNSGYCNRLYNHYGPTETTIGATIYKVENNSGETLYTGSVPIGKAIGQNDCLLVKTKDSIGELYISGPGLSMGYFRNEKENRKKFIYKTLNSQPVKYYKTGDICKQHSDGNLEFLFRKDRQVKINGYRIELGEIEMCIASHPQVENVTVSASEQDTNKIMLSAYIKPIEGTRINKNIILDWLLKKLPNYKVPANLFFYKKTPFTPNGKIDIKALEKKFTADDGKHLRITESAHQSWAESVTANWKTVLFKSKVKDADNFFLTGGDSLLAIQLIGRLQRRGFKIHISDLNENPVFEKFKALKKGKLLPQVYRHTADSETQLSYSQRLFFKSQGFDQNNYCQTMLFEIQTKVEVRALALALNTVVKNHPQLRSTFVNHQSGINKNHAVELGVTVLGRNESIAVQINRATKKLLGTVSINTGNLFIAHLFINTKGRDFLFLACHHLSVDVISWTIILDELLEYYRKAMSETGNEMFEETSISPITEILLKEKQQNGNPNIELLNRSVIISAIKKQSLHTSASNVYSIIFPEKTSLSLKNNFSAGSPVTTDGLLLYAFSNAALQASNLSNLKIDVEFHGRSNDKDFPDLSRSVSWWAITLPLDLEYNGLSAENYSKILTKKSAEAARVNLTGALSLHASNDKPKIRFNFLGHFPSEYRNSSICLRPALFNPGPTRNTLANQEYELFFTSRFIGSRLIVDIQYSKPQFSWSRVNQIAHLFSAYVKESIKAGNPAFNDFLPHFSDSNMPTVGQPLFNIDCDFKNEPGAKTVIFLTGVTGFLGFAILKELLKDNNTEIYCLVRQPGLHEAMERIKKMIGEEFAGQENDKILQIKLFAGDLLSEHFSLEKQAFAKISSEAGIIIHAAANVNLTKSYSELKPINIDAVEKVIQLALTGKKKKLHFVSTLSVSGINGGINLKDFSENDFEHGQHFLSEYEKTKFEAEKLMRQFISKGNDGMIYRVGHIAAESTSGKFQVNGEQNRIFQLLKGIMLLKQIPDCYDEKVSFSYVDIVAKGISNLALKNTATKQSCLHLENPFTLSFLAIAGLLNTLDYKIEVVSLEQFNSTVAEYSGSAADKRTVELSAIWIQRYLSFPRRINYTQAYSNDILASIGLAFPETDLDWFNKMITNAISSGYFHLPVKTQKNTVFIQ